MKPLISVIIPTLGRETLYLLIENLIKQKSEFPFEIILIPQVKLKKLPDDKRIRIFNEKHGKGFSFYRNVGIEKSKGDILVFIDDDEMPMNEHWLMNITTSITKGKETVVTSGYKIRLGQGYFADCISLLGFPGGGAVGFEVMWPLKNPPYTDHICTGNLAISKRTMNRIGNFENYLIYGAEDIHLADKLIAKNINIIYSKESTVYHVARKGYLNFVKWNILRGKSIRTYASKNKSRNKITNRISSSLRILSIVARNKIIYLPGVLFFMANQYIWQGIGYILNYLRYLM